eukprot:COSAG01_NODE_46473_length_399_cov_100.170000_2_plen_59_part_01
MEPVCGCIGNCQGAAAYPRQQVVWCLDALYSAHEGGNSTFSSTCGPLRNSISLFLLLIS